MVWCWPFYSYRFLKTNDSNQNLNESVPVENIRIFDGNADLRSILNKIDHTDIKFKQNHLFSTHFNKNDSKMKEQVFCNLFPKF